MDRVEPRVDAGRLARDIARAAGEGGTLLRLEVEAAL